jgi:hypothetical protein
MEHAALVFYCNLMVLLLLLPQVPISATRAINRFCLIRNFALNPAFDFMARE